MCVYVCKVVSARMQRLDRSRYLPLTSLSSSSSSSVPSEKDRNGRGEQKGLRARIPRRRDRRAEIFSTRLNVEAKTFQTPGSTLVHSRI